MSKEVVSDRMVSIIFYVVGSVGLVGGYAGSGAVGALNLVTVLGLGGGVLFSYRHSKRNKEASKSDPEERV